MTKKFLYLTTKTYMSKDYSQYLGSLDKGEEYDEADFWKRDLEDDQEKTPPKAFLARVAIDPSQIMAYVETYSLEELHNNPDKPKFDSIDLCMNDGLQITILDTMESFEKKLTALND